MSCLLCGAERATRRIVDPEDETVAAEVCEACAEEYLLVDDGSPTCEFCSEMGDYDLAKLSVPLHEATQLDVESDLDIVTKDVLCEEHLGDLVADAA